MKRTKKCSLPFRALCAFMVALIVNLPVLSLKAVDIQTLPDTVAGQHGFTHGAYITWDDLNAADNSSTTLQLIAIPTNSYVDRVAFIVPEEFTNSTASATNLLLCVGVGGSTNAFFTTNQIDGSTTMASSGLTLWTLSTNMLVPYKSTTSTNYLIATFSAGASTVDTYTRGKIRIYWRLVQPNRIRLP